MNAKQLLSLSLASTLASCASIVSSTTWPVIVSTTPPNARVEVYNSDDVCVHTGQSPMTVLLPSGDGFFGAASYRFSAVGPANERGVVEAGAHLNGWYFGNIIFGGLIGLLIVDPATGAMYRMPEAVHIDLRRKAAP